MCDFIIMDELILQAYQMNTNKLSDLSVRLMRMALNNVQNQIKKKKRGRRENSDYVGDHPGKCNPRFSSCYLLFLEVLI